MIINFGEIGDKFYIILSGSVGIYKPTPKTVDMTLKEYADYLLKIRDYERNPVKFERIQNFNPNVNKFKLMNVDL